MPQSVAALGFAFKSIVSWPATETLENLIVRDDVAVDWVGDAVSWPFTGLP